MNFYQNNKRVLLPIFGLIGFSILTYLCFQYARIAPFPTGDDPAIHIYNVGHSSFLEIIKKTIYPIPLLIFKALHTALATSYPTLFVYLIPSYLLFSSIGVLLLSKKLSNSWLLAFLSAAVFTVSSWVVDGLRMGLLAETLGWGMLAYTLYFLVSQNITGTLIFSFLLAFSHPFSLTVYALFFVLYFLLGIIVGDRKEKKFLLTIAALYLFAAATSLFLKPGLLSSFINFVNPERVGWGERSLWEILTTFDARRIIIAFFAFIAFVLLAKRWKEPICRALYILLFLGLFLSLNYLFGIRFLPFRFYPYLEMAIAIAAPLGLEMLLQRLEVLQKPLFLLIASAIFIAPIYLANAKITYNQVHDSALDDSLTAGDQKAIDWIGQNISAGETIAAERKRQIWIVALTDKQKAAIDPTPYSEKELAKFYGVGDEIGYDYIYYSELNVVPETIKQYYHQIYDNGGVMIYERD